MAGGGLYNAAGRGSSMNVQVISPSKKISIKTYEKMVWFQCDTEEAVVVFPRPVTTEMIHTLVTVESLMLKLLYATNGRFVFSSECLRASCREWCAQQTDYHRRDGLEAKVAQIQTEEEWRRCRKEWANGSRQTRQWYHVSEKWRWRPSPFLEEIVAYVRNTSIEMG